LLICLRRGGHFLVTTTERVSRLCVRLCSEPLSSFPPRPCPSLRCPRHTDLSFVHKVREPGLFVSSRTAARGGAAWCGATSSSRVPLSKLYTLRRCNAIRSLPPLSIYLPCIGHDEKEEHVPPRKMSHARGIPDRRVEYVTTAADYLATSLHFSVLVDLSRLVRAIGQNILLNCGIVRPSSAGFLPISRRGEERERERGRERKGERERERERERDRVDQSSRISSERGD